MEINVLNFRVPDSADFTSFVMTVIGEDPFIKPIEHVIFQVLRDGLQSIS